MNPVAQRILETGAVSDGDVVYPLGQYHMDAREGSVLQKAIAAVRPIVSLEIGMAYGLSTLFICEELAKQHGKATHVVIDPFQNSDWRGIGMRHVREAGYEHLGDVLRRTLRVYVATTGRCRNKAGLCTHRWLAHLRPGARRVLLHQSHVAGGRHRGFRRRGLAKSESTAALPRRVPVLRSVRQSTPMAIVVAGEIAPTTGVGAGRCQDCSSDG